MDDTTPNPHDEDPGELLESFRWTQQLARRLVHDPALAADVHQDTWTRALERFGDAIPGRAWLAGTLRSMAYRARRGSGRRKLHEARGARTEAVGSTAELIERSEAQQRVASAVARLPEDLRVVLLLHFQEGLSLAAIARHLGCSKSTAGERVQRGVAALRREMRTEDGGWRACSVLAVPFGAGLGSLPPIALASLESTPPSVAATGALSSTTLTGVALKKLVLVASVVALLALGASSLRGLTAERAAGSDDVSSAGLVTQVEPPRADPVVDLVRDPAPAERSAPRVPIVPERPRAEAFTFVARVVDADGLPVSAPRIVAEGLGLRREAVGSDDGALDLQLVADDLAALARNDLGVQIAGGEYQTLWETTIDADGTSAIAPPVLGVVEDLGTITLQPAGAVEGRAHTSGGRPIAGARIGVYGYDSRNPERRSTYGGVAPEVVTDAEGRFRVPHLLPGPAGLAVRHGEFLVDAPITEVDVLAGVTTGPVYLNASPAAIVTGRVVDLDGTPIEGAYVNGTGNWSRLDSDETDADGRFRIGLREGSPAVVEAYCPGWRQIEPAIDTPQGPGELEIVLERILPDAAYRVRIVDAETGQRIHFAGVAVLPGGGVEGPYAGPAPALVTQPEEGIPLDYLPGEDLLVAGAKGYRTTVLATAAQAETAPHLTLAIRRADGVHGRLLEGGRPVVGARVQLTSVTLHLAEPRESLSAGRTLRHPTERADTKALTGFGGHSPESVLGLDGMPPPHRLVTGGVQHGAITDEEGRFHLRDVKSPSVGLLVQLDGRPVRGLGTYTLDQGTLDLGDLEVDPSASLAGRFESTWPWEPAQHAVILRNPRREVPIEPDGSFFVDELEPGPVHFTLEAAGQEIAFGEFLTFEDVPVFHVDLAAQEARSVTVSLDPYAPSSLDLEVTIGGRDPLENCMLEVTPVDEPARTFRLWCDVEGSRITASTRALGPCHLSLTQASGEGGIVRVHVPGPAFDLRPGETVRRTVDIPAGHLRLSFPADHPGLRYDDLDLALEGGGVRVELGGMSHGGETGPAAHEPQTLRTGPIPPGTYRATLTPSRWRYPEEATEVLAEFDVTVTSGETTEIPVAF